MTDIWKLSASQLSAAYTSKQLSPVEVTEALIGRCESHAEPLNAISQTLYEQGLIAAKAAEQRYQKQKQLSPLDGVPCTIKECIATEGHLNRMGTKILAQAKSDDFTAPSSERLLSAGAILIAKTTMTDFGLAGSGASTMHGNCMNPYDHSNNTNGSSSGAAVSLAVGAVPIALGSDLCGSIRNPAAWCGVIGYKQNFGSIGHIPAAWGRHAGPMARSVADIKTMFDIMRGPHHLDANTIPEQPPRQLPNSLAGIKVGLILNAHNMPTAEPSITEAVMQVASLLQAAGAEIINLSDLSLWSETMKAWHYYLGLTGSLTMSRLSPAERQLVPDNMMAFNELSGPTTALESSQAVFDMHEARQKMHQQCQQVEVLLSPTIPYTPFAVDLYGPDNDPQRHIEHLHYTGIYNLTGQPAITIPGGLDHAGMPIGIQLATNLYEDDKLLWIAEQLESMLAFDYSKPLQ